MQIITAAWPALGQRSRSFRWHGCIRLRLEKHSVACGWLCMHLFNTYIVGYNWGFLQQTCRPVTNIYIYLSLSLSIYLHRCVDRYVSSPISVPVFEANESVCEPFCYSEYTYVYIYICILYICTCNIYIYIYNIVIYFSSHQCLDSDTSHAAEASWMLDWTSGDQLKQGNMDMAITLGMRMHEKKHIIYTPCRCQILAYMSQWYRGILRNLFEE